MTAVTEGRRAGRELPGSPPGPIRRCSGAARMEWIKLRSLRSSSWMLIIAAAGVIGLGILVLSFYPSHWAHMTAAQRASFDPTNQGFTGIALGQLVAGIFGVLAITGEYSSGSIRATLSATPSRLMMLAAKAAVVGAAALLVGEAVCLAAFLIGQDLVLSSPAPHAMLGQAGTARAVVMTGGYLCLSALIGLGLGAIIRHTAGAIAAFTAVVLVLPFVSAALPGSLQQAVVRYLPEQIASNSLAAVRPEAGSLSPWAGMGMLCLYAAVLLLIGGWQLARRDA